MCFPPVIIELESYSFLLHGLIATNTPRKRQTALQDASHGTFIRIQIKAHCNVGAAAMPNLTFIAQVFVILQVQPSEAWHMMQEAQAVWCFKATLTAQ